MDEFSNHLEQGATVAFAVPNLNIGKCGVSDYAMRMAALLSQQGISTKVLATKGENIGETIQTPEGDVRIGRLTEDEAKCCQLLAVQYVPNLNKSALEFYSDVSLTRHPRIHLMIHECWRSDMFDYKISIREKVTSFRQKLLLRRLLKQWKPRSIATSNVYYQSLLKNKGIDAVCSPMPGNIPLGTARLPDEKMTLPIWWHARSDFFVWIHFGGLHAKFWSCVAHFAEARKIAETCNIQFAWVVAGKQNQEDIAVIQNAAKSKNFDQFLHITGPLPSEKVDWWLRNADAAFSATPGELWAKSGGILASVERKLPVLLTRGWGSEEIEPGGIFTSDIASTIEQVHAKNSNLSSAIHWRTGDSVAKRFIEQFIVDKPKDSNS